MDNWKLNAASKYYKGCEFTRFNIDYHQKKSYVIYDRVLRTHQNSLLPRTCKFFITDLFGHGESYKSVCGPAIPEKLRLENRFTLRPVARAF